jgi:hypothetical protein
MVSISKSVFIGQFSSDSESLRSSIDSGKGVATQMTRLLRGVTDLKPIRVGQGLAGDPRDEVRAALLAARTHDALFFVKAGIGDDPFDSVSQDSFFWRTDLGWRNASTHWHTLLTDEQLEAALVGDCKESSPQPEPDITDAGAINVDATRGG